MNVRTVNNLPRAAAHDEAVRCLPAIELSKMTAWAIMPEFIVYLPIGPGWSLSDFSEPCLGSAKTCHKTKR